MTRAATWPGAFWYVMALGVFVAAGVFAAPAAAGNSKVVICHIPPGDPDNAHTITVSEKAVPAHLKHGDWLGECASGCLNHADCNDENLCTDDECLSNGECSHVAVDCDDSNVCTDDLCDPAEGCVYPPVSVSTECDDNNVCTSADTCEAGICTGTDVFGCCLEASECDDGDWCTDGACEGNVCVYSAVDCSIPDDACFEGFCDPLASMCVAAPVSCDDLDVCTDDLCDSVTGCYNPSTTNPPEPGMELTCDDGVDNDCDGLADSADGDCGGFCGNGALDEGEDCDDGNNVDGDGCNADCSYQICGTIGQLTCPAGFDCIIDCAPGTTDCPGICVPSSCVPTDEICDDGVDNDCDGDVDSADEDCAPSCVPTDEICDDGVDNDCDGAVDSEDGDCAAVDCNAGYPGLVYGGYDYAGRTDSAWVDDFILTEVVPACMQDVLDKGCDTGGVSLEDACLVPLVNEGSCEFCLTGGYSVSCSLCWEARSLQLNMICDDLTLDVCSCVPTGEVCDDFIDNDCDGDVDSEDGDCGGSCGNGALDEGEDCDDGNNVDGDGCNADCSYQICGTIGQLTCPAGFDCIIDCAPGTTDCPGICVPSSCVPTDEICDGVDNDCDGSIDETPAVGYTYSDFPLRDETPLGCAETLVVEDTGVVCGDGVGQATLACERDPGGLLHATYSRTGCAGTVQGDVSVDVEASLDCAVLDSSTAPGVDFIWFNSFQCCDLPPRSCSVDNGRCGDARVFQCTPDEVTEATCQLITWDMVGANLSGAQLYSKDLSYVDLSFADLTGADLYNANLSNATLDLANLTDANLNLTNFSGASLQSAQFSGAFVAYADLRGADLRSVNLATAASWFGATYNGATQFDPGVDPSAYGMFFVP